MSNPLTIQAQDNGDGTCTITFANVPLQAYVAPVSPPPPPPPVSPPPAPPPPPPATDGTNIGAIQPGDTWVEPTGS